MHCHFINSQHNFLLRIDKGVVSHFFRMKIKFQFFAPDDLITKNPSVQPKRPDIDYIQKEDSQYYASP